MQAQDLLKDKEVVAIKIMSDKSDEGDHRMRGQAAQEVEILKLVN